MEYSCSKLTKMSQWWRWPTWLNREICLELKEKNKIYDVWWKGQETQEDYKDIVRLRREKIKRAKVQLELSLDSAINDNKNVFVTT